MGFFYATGDLVSSAAHVGRRASIKYWGPLPRHLAASLQRLGTGRPSLRSSRRVLERREHPMNSTPQAALSKVPQVTLGFWIIKISAATLGETGGEAPSCAIDVRFVVIS